MSPSRRVRTAPRFWGRMTRSGPFFSECPPRIQMLVAEADLHAPEPEAVQPVAVIPVPMVARLEDLDPAARADVAVKNPTIAPHPVAVGTTMTIAVIVPLLFPARVSPIRASIILVTWIVVYLLKDVRLHGSSTRRQGAPQHAKRAEHRRSG
jgi:hypothetical protein